MVHAHGHCLRFFTYSRSDKHFVHGLLPLHPQLCGFRKFGWRKDGFCYFSAGQDGGRIENAQSSVGRAVD